MVLVFDIRADQAMFRKPYTTTSMVSFPFPPPTVVSGLLGAIVGYDHGSSQGALRADYWKLFKGTRIALRLNNPVSWYSTTVNLIKFKTPNGDMSEHIQVKHQFLKRPSYRIYVEGGEVHDQLKKHLEREEFIFTPFLGVAYALADISYVGEFEEYQVDDGSIFLDSVLPWYGDLLIDVGRSGPIHSEVVPFRLDELRRQKETINVIYPGSRDRNRICLRNRGDVKVTLVGQERVAWFEPW